RHEVRAMQLSEKTLETLLDLVEIKLSCIQVFDRDDAREVATLERAKQELVTLSGSGEILAFPGAERRRRGRPRKMAVA
ncbi:MAG: hypothetical protein ACFCVH_22465, partial [Alphaproteobacteria bacterium]